MDIIESILGDCKKLELLEYYILATARMYSVGDAQVKQAMQTSLFAEDVVKHEMIDEPMMKVIFLIVLHADKSLQEVCTRGTITREPLKIEHRRNFFLNLSFICDDYMESKINEKQMILHAKSAYDNTYNRVELVKSRGEYEKVKKKRKQRPKKSDSGKKIKSSPTSHRA